MRSAERLLRDLYGNRDYLSFQEDRLKSSMIDLGLKGRRFRRGLTSLCYRYSEDPLVTWKRVGELVGHYKTGEPLSRERARQMACGAMRWLQHPHRRKFILEGEKE